MQKEIFKKLNLIIFISFFITFQTASALEYSDNSIAQNTISLSKEERIPGNKLIVKLKDNYNRGEEDYNENYANVRLDSALKINDNFSAKSVLKFEQLRPGTKNNFGNHNRSFENEGGFIEELTLNYDLDKFSLMAGKFTVDFADGWNQNGIWSQDMAYGYRFSEKLGAATFFKVGDKKTNGEYVFGLSSFANDRKYLANSIITSRDVPSKEDATPGDVGGISSYNGSLNILFDFGNKEELTYHFSYLNLAVNERASQLPRGKADDQKGYAANINYKYPYSENIVIKPFIEYVTFKNYGGNSDDKANFLTTNLSFDLYKNWGVTISRNKGKVAYAGLAKIANEITEFSGGYKFSNSSLLNGLQISLGYKENKVDDKVTKTSTSAIGLLARYVKLF